MAQRRFPLYDRYCSYADLEIPLLEAVARRGGAIWFSQDGCLIEHEIAEHFRLPEELRDLTDPEVNSEGHRVWRMMIQQARRRLVHNGEMEMPQRDRWQMTAAGYDRIGVPMPS